MNEGPESTLMPDSITTEFRQLSEDLSWAYARWMLFRQLYAHSEKRLNLLEHSASAFFEFTFHILRDDVIMALTRLADPERNRQQENLSLEQIMTCLGENNVHAELLAKLRKKLDLFKELCRPLKTHRHKRLAHRDLKLSLAGASEPLPRITVVMIDKALASAGDFLNVVKLHFDNSQTGYEHFGMTGDADALIYHLAEVQRYKELVSSGGIGWDDFRKSK